MIKTTAIETSIAFLEIRDEVLFVVFKEGVEIQLENIDEIIKARKVLQQGKKVLVLTDIRNVWHASKAAKARAGNEEFLKLSYATAILVGSLPTRLLANFYIKFNKPKVSTKMFTSKEKALTWLKFHN